MAYITRTIQTAIFQFDENSMKGKVSSGVKTLVHLYQSPPHPDKRPIFWEYLGMFMGINGRFLFQYLDERPIFGYIWVYLWVSRGVQ